MSRVAFPFFTLGSDAVRVDEWVLVDEGREVVIDNPWITDWDSARDVTIRRRLSIDFDIAGSQLQVDVRDLALLLVVRIGTGAGNMPRAISTVVRRQIRQGDGEILIDERVSGRTLSHRLLAETLILLAEPAADSHSLSPVRPASKIWFDRLDLRLEGEEPRFPMEALSFSNRFAGRPEAHAPWYLHWFPGNLHRDFGGSVRLFLNSDRPDFTERLLAGDRATLQVVLGDVMTQIISTSLRQPDFEQATADSDASSIAGRVGFWIRIAFPGQDVRSVRSILDLRPSTFHAAILAAADVVTQGADL